MRSLKADPLFAASQIPPLPGWAFQAVHIAGLAALLFPAASVLSSGAPGAGAPATLQEEFARACPTGRGVSGASIAWRWLAAEPNGQVFSGAEDPWLCGAAHAAFLLEAQAAILAAVALSTLTTAMGRRASVTGPLLLFWACAGSALCAASAARRGGGGAGGGGAPAAAVLSACVAGAGAALYAMLRCAGGQVEVPSGGATPGAAAPAAPAAAAVAAAAAAAAATAPAGDGGGWLSFAASGAAAEQRFTDALQASFERGAAGLQRARAAERAERAFAPGGRRALAGATGGRHLRT